MFSKLWYDLLCDVCAMTMLFVCLGICNTIRSYRTCILDVVGGWPNGGGGGGGRIAMYYTGDHHYNGQLLTHGGRGNGHHGGAGTMYLAQVSGTAVSNTLTVDNGRLTSSERIAEVEKLDLAGNGVSKHNMSFTTYSGLHFSTTGPVYTYGYLYTLYRSFFFIRSGAQNTYYQSPQKQAIITVELPFLMYIDHIIIYPLCDR